GSQCVAIVGVQGHLPAISSQTPAIRPPTQYSLTILGLISYPDNPTDNPRQRSVRRALFRRSTPSGHVWTVFLAARSQRPEHHLNARLPTLPHLVFARLASLCQFHPLTCPPIDTFPSLDSAVLEIGPGGAVYAGPIGEAAKLWRER